MGQPAHSQGVAAHTASPLWPLTPEARSNPEAILAARDALVATGEHLHGPEIAARLGVPEAAVVAARLGRDAFELACDVPALLAPMAAWSKCLLALRSAFGVALAIGRFRAPQMADGHLSIASEEHSASVHLAAADRAYLLEEHDMHGHSVSINIFDAAGDALLRVFLMSKEGREHALPHLQRHRLSAQERRWQPRGQVDPSRGHSVAASDPAAADSLREALLALAAGSARQVLMHSATSALTSRFRATHTSDTPPTTHATSSALKLHLRPGAAVAVEASSAGRAWRAANGDRFVLGSLEETAP
ncbi:MAG: ChuX/HutX family heme-like substrate-binding protein [Burkholderiales bacterium]|nr:ChuX/HutX family heme-like substrate-binding protein [Burkholderiales bacterium]